MNTIQGQLPVTPLAVWSLILGIAALTLCCLPLAIPAIICGHLARAQVKQAPGVVSGSGMAMAGLIMGYLSVGVLILACILGAIMSVTVLPLIMRMIQQLHAG